MDNVEEGGNGEENTWHAVAASVCEGGSDDMALGGVEEEARPSVAARDVSTVRGVVSPGGGRGSGASKGAGNFTSEGRVKPGVNGSRSRVGEGVQRQRRNGRRAGKVSRPGQDEEEALHRRVVSLKQMLRYACQKSFAKNPTKESCFTQKRPTDVCIPHNSGMHAKRAL